VEKDGSIPSLVTITRVINMKTLILTLISFLASMLGAQTVTYYGHAPLTGGQGSFCCSPWLRVYATTGINFGRIGGSIPYYLVGHQGDPTSTSNSITNPSKLLMVAAGFGRNAQHLPIPPAYFNGPEALGLLLIQPVNVIEFVMARNFPTSLTYTTTGGKTLYFYYTVNIPNDISLVGSTLNLQAFDFKMSTPTTVYRHTDPLFVSQGVEVVIGR